MIKKKVRNEKNNKEKNQKIIDNVYRVKIAAIRKKIIFNGIILGILGAIILSIYFFGESQQNQKTEKLSKLKSEIKRIEENLEKAKNKISDAKKYKAIWLDASKSKKNFDHIRISDIRKRFNNLAKEYNLSDPSITIQSPKEISNGIYNNESLETISVSFNIKFNTILDSKALQFINQFKETFTGFIIVEEVSLNKINADSFNQNDLIEISKGKAVNLVSATAKYSWYYIRKKTNDQTIN